MIKDYDTSKISLIIDGLNSQLSDIDFYDQVRLAVKKTDSLSYDVTLPSYFRKNPYITQLAQVTSPVFSHYLSALESILPHFDKSINYKGLATPMLDSIKNSLVGKPHSPHPYFIEKGAHSITLATHGSD